MQEQATGRRGLLQNALVAINDLESRLEAAEHARREPIAIIGMACRFPGGATTPEAYWRLLESGVDAVRQADRWDTAAFAASVPGVPAAWYGGFLDDLDQFDPKFFSISPREAATMDPQQRLALEVAWEALERAGVAPDQLAGSLTGVFMGASLRDYADLCTRVAPDQLDVYTATGSGLNVIAGRISYILGLNGPAMAIDTACSSSLVAVHLAVQSLRNGETRMALAGGVNVLLSPEGFLCFAKWGMMAGDGRCKTFDDRADGFVRAEGCGMLVLKRLSDAEADGDHVLAVIRGSAVNQDGHSSGLTVPSGPAQKAVIQQALANAGVAPHEVSYVEAHGTGTSIGDPIEVEALAAALSPGRAADDPFYVGSVKTNIGHAESASGIAGLIKTVLALQYRALPAHLHLTEKSSQVQWDELPIKIPTHLTPWEPRSGRRVAGVSSFGFSGTNAHVLLEQAADALVAAVSDEPRPALHVLALSARSDTALSQLAGRYADFFTGNPSVSLADAAFTTNTGRARFAERLAVVAATPAEAVVRLSLLGADAPSANPIARGRAAAGDPPRVAFLFTGQGAQYVGMGRQLYQTEPVFRAALDRCADLLQPYLERPLLEVLFADDTDSEAAALLDQTAFTQPALFSIEYSLAALWRTWGVRPDLVLGHSVGEYVAACVAGVFSLEDGLKLIAARGRLMQALPANGAMLSVFAPESAAVRAIAGFHDKLAIAAVNAPEHVVVSGEAGAVRDLAQRLIADGIGVRELKVSHAFHSPLLDPMLDAFERIAAATTFHAPRVRLISNVTGALVGPDELAQAGYWRRHARQPVRFADAVGTLQAQGADVLVEIGPHPVLLGMAHDCLAASEQSSLTSVPSLKRKRPDDAIILDSLAHLWTRGVPVDWTAVEGSNSGPVSRRMVLPTYPFQRQRFWVGTGTGSGQTARAGRATNDDQHPFLGPRVRLAYAPGTSVWEGEVSTDAFPYLDDHRIQGAPILPATAYMEMVHAAARDTGALGTVTLTDTQFKKTIMFAPGVRWKVQVVLTRDDAAEGQFTFQVFSQRIGPGAANPDTLAWAQNVTGRLQVGGNPPSDVLMDAPALEAIRARSLDEIDGHDFYARLADKGNQWGPAFQATERVWRGEDEALASLRVPESIEADLDRYQFHPAIADAAGHVLASLASMQASAANKGGAFVGGGIDESRFYARPVGRNLWSYARLRHTPDQASNVLIGDVQLFDETGALVAETIGARLRYIDENQAPDPVNVGDWFYDVQWRAADSARTLPVAPPRNWVVLADSTGAGDRVAASIRSRGLPCVIVRRGDDYVAPIDGEASVRPTVAEDYWSLLAEFGAGDSGVGLGVVHLWAMDTPDPDDTPPAVALTDAHTLGAASVAALLRALSETSWRTSPRVWLVTRGAHTLTADQSCMSPAQASLWGFGRAAAIEHADLWGGLVDLDPDASAESTATLLMDELLCATGENQVALRGGARYTARLARVASASVDATATLQFQADATYLITGGLGGLGLQVARWMVGHGARQLVLAGRSALPPRRLWSSVAGDDELGRKLAAIADLEAAGAVVRTPSLDVADETAVADLMQALHEQGAPPLRGVVHAAGVLRHDPAADLDAAALDSVARPKAQGAWVLHRALASQPLDFFVLFSSASALLSSPRLAAYAAANAALDALAHRRQRAGLPCLSVDWGVWGQDGMAAAVSAQDLATLSSRGMGSMTTSQGLEALERLMADPATGPQVAVLPVNWVRWSQLYPALVGSAFLSEVTPRTQVVRVPGSPGLSRDSLMSIEPAEQQMLVQRFLGEQAAAVLGLDTALEPPELLGDFGLDSLMAVELKNSVENQLDVVLPMVVFLQGPSIADLAEQVLSRLGHPPTASEQQPLLEFASSAADGLLAEIDELSEDQVDAMLRELLAREESGAS
jgi:acyl transferase domain-containing protein/acyl carrier protein